MAADALRNILHSVLGLGEDRTVPVVSVVVWAEYRNRLHL